MIQLNNISKKIKDKTILQNINLEINQGDVIALVGPNGAGKSTLIDVLLGNKKASGEIIGSKYLLDHHFTSVLYQHTYYTPHMKVRQIIELFQNLYEKPLSIKQIQQITLFDDDILNRPAQKLSGGQQRILDVALTLMGQPEFIILDEPTAGMDTNTRKRFYELVEELKLDGKTILFTSHYIEEVETLADRIVLLNQGEIIRDSTPRLIRIEDKKKLIVVPKSIKLIHAHKIKEDSQFSYYETEKIDEVMQYLVKEQVSFAEIEMTNISLLESVFKAVEVDNHETV
ncbi:ABC transporter ATP-binding protein [Macrococcus brunensis]|uniref:ABC transporter ATP-binding protein n=1 Tax=Macrococcus brunensis TaxID=198483 RepID=A0A4R6BE48_9STAP|nr:ABC transporter ATP-binding protein [Macrococcus brunensis]TDL98042.1 ABC transporter ATP-binding protein [Macrococcus brunensis]ULG72323.1 ABC transporter ATP-binding protein [Macrococcus brunensis]ULG74583.1 ABC transporter ATP-binding protein [Macrococcus brunensis]